MWKKTSCVCCGQNCGLEVLVENNRITGVRPDKANPRSQGYCCRKGLKIAHYQHHGDRLQSPLKKNGIGFSQISWDQALDEISQKLKKIIADHGPRSLAYMGGGGQGCHFEAAFGVRLLRGLGSYYHYSPLAQELTGYFWVNGRAFGRQYFGTIPDHQNTDLLLAIGWNGWQSHQIPQARRHLKRISEDSTKLLVVIDPRHSETARKADIHVALRPGTDALLLKSIISIILQNGWAKKQYIEQYTHGFNSIKDLFLGLDARKAIALCEVDYDQVLNLCRLLTTRSWSCHSDLGILMGRHSTLSSYLEVILLAICGRIGVPGGNYIPSQFMPLGAHSDERDAKTWRTVATNFPAVLGVFPPNVMPEEILSDHRDRLRAVLVSASNPLRSYADTSLFEKAFDNLDLSVTIDVALSETARQSQYVLPAKSAYEKWDGTFFSWNYPEMFFQMRHPVVECEGEAREESEILIELAERLDLLPEIPAHLFEAAYQDRMTFGMQLLNYAQSEPKAMKFMPFILGKTLGKALGSPNLAALWGLLQTAPKQFRESANRAGFDPGLDIGERIFQSILDHPEGIQIGVSDTEDAMGILRTEDKKINIFIPELEEGVRAINPENEYIDLQLPPEFPLLLTAGRHMDCNANTVMRDPIWNAGMPRPCTLLMHPHDSQSLGFVDGQQVQITTEAGSEIIELQITEYARPGQIVMPHGFGLIHEGKAYGPNVNRLTKNTHRDPYVGTPLHRFVPCRVNAV